MVAQLHDWNRFSAQNSMVKVNYKGYWNYGRCHDCHNIFLSHPEFCCMKMIKECLFTDYLVYMLERKKRNIPALINMLWIHSYLDAFRVQQTTYRSTAATSLVMHFLVFFVASCWQSQVHNRSLDFLHRLCL